MSTQSTVPIFAPDGTLRDVPYEHMKEAVAAGGHIGWRMKTPDGSIRVVPDNMVAEATKNGGKALPADEQQHPGAFKALASDLGEMVGKPLAAAGEVASGQVAGPNTVDMGTKLVDAFEQDAEARKQGYVAGLPEKAVTEGIVNRRVAGHGVPYAVTAGVAENALGVNVAGMEQSAKEGDVAGVYGHAATVPAVMLASEGLARGAGPVMRASGRVADMLPETVRPSGAQAFAMPREVGEMPAKAVLGAEDVFRAAAPTGSNPGFRGNVYAAAGDLAEIGRKVNVAEAKGGIINPDMRVRATVDAIGDHLSEMYQKERLPQIQAHADAPVDIPLGDATRGLQYLQRTAGTLAEQELAARGLKGSLPLVDADRLAMNVNQQLKAFEAMTPAEKQAALAKNPKIGGLKALDQALSKGMNKILTDGGDVGLQSYERRYAALSEIRDQLQGRMNAAELKQEGVLGAAGRITRPISKLVTGGKSGIASASQAAVADVNIGRTLQNGLNSLAESGLEADRTGTRLGLRKRVP